MHLHLSSKCWQCQSALNLLIPMYERSDYKPFVPVGGCANVLKSHNPAAPTHLREACVTRERVYMQTEGHVYLFIHVIVHPLSVCGFKFIYTYFLFTSVCNLVCLFEKESRNVATVSGTCRVCVARWFNAELWCCKIMCVSPLCWFSTSSNHGALLETFLIMSSF